MKNVYFFILIFSVVTCANGQVNLDDIINLNCLEKNQIDSIYKNLIKLNKKITNKSSKEFANFAITYSTVLKYLSKADSSYYYLDRAERFFLRDEQKYQEKLFEIYTLKAELNRFYGKREDALKYIYKAKKNFNNNFNINKKAYYYNRRVALLSTYYNYNKDSVNLINSQIKKILIESSRIKDKSIIVYSLNELGFLEFNRNPQLALNYFKKAYDTAYKYNTKRALVDVSLNLGRVNQQKFYNYAKAIKYHKIAAKYAKEIESNWQSKEAMINLRICYGLIKDFETAVSYSDSVSHYIIKESVQENASIVKVLERKYNFELKENEIKEKEKNFLFLLLFTFFMIVVVIMMLVYNSKINRKNITLNELVKENNFLVKETNHRINNNLQFVAALLSNFKRTVEGITLKSRISELQSKINSIALLHRHLYISKSKRNIDVQKYIQAIIESFNQDFEEKDIELKVIVSSIELDSDTVMYLGLIVTELILNSLKHAFTNQPTKKIDLKLVIEDKHLYFRYSDNGLNNSNNYQPNLINQLCMQLNIQYDLSTNNGCTLTFEKVLTKEQINA